MAKSEWTVGLIYVGVLALLPVLGYWARRDPRPTCAHNGCKIEPLYRVRVIDADGRDRAFCCIGCAQAWLRRQSQPPRNIRVTDENSGAEVDAAAATFVRSLVVTNRITGNRIHAFANRSDAESHAQSLGGRILDAAEKPFAGQ
jgi:hypothetical protein